MNKQMMRSTVKSQIEKYGVRLNSGVHGTCNPFIKLSELGCSRVALSEAVLVSMDLLIQHGIDFLKIPFTYYQY